MNQDPREAIFDKVISTIADIAGVNISELQGSTELIADLALDSLAMYEIVIELEDVFDLQISDSDIDRIHTVDDAVAYILDSHSA
ncbi:MAG: acyl carrier protein [Eubacteriales bacterium]|nr:acyl carrier protein [Eubacteriales bacterium]